LDSKSEMLFKALFMALNLTIQPDIFYIKNAIRHQDEKPENVDVLIFRTTRMGLLCCGISFKLKNFSNPIVSCASHDEPNKARLNSAFTPPK
jgi:hypothetical protein